MPKPSKPKPKLTESQRHKRFKEAAREVGASENPKDLAKALKQVAGPKK